MCRNCNFWSQRMVRPRVGNISASKLKFSGNLLLLPQALLEMIRVAAEVIVVVSPAHYK